MSWFLLLLFFFTHQLPARVSSSIQVETSSLEALSDRYDAFLLDAYGVFWGSNDVGVFPGAANAMAYLVAHGKYVGILSNSTQLAKREKEKFKRYGLQEGVHYHFLLTSGEVARELFVQDSLPFSTPNHAYWVFGAPHPKFGTHLQLFEGTCYRETLYLNEADFIYIAIPHIDGQDQENPEVFRSQVASVESALPILCVNPDRFAPEGTPHAPLCGRARLRSYFPSNRLKCT